MNDETLELALDLLSECDGLGIHLRIAGGGQLSVVGPDAVLTDELLGRIRNRKPELLEALECTLPPLEPMEIGPDGWPTDTFQMPPCSRCGFSDYWQACIGDLKGRTDPVWRCLRCDPPRE